MSNGEIIVILCSIFKMYDFVWRIYYITIVSFGMHELLLGLSEESLEQQPVFEEEEHGKSVEDAPLATSPSDTV